MRLPKRVPWSNAAELEELCSWIYAAGEDLASKALAVNRLAAWKASTALPHALESTLSFLIVILQDEDYSNSPAPHSSTLALRHSYSLSLIRMVNGLVDPLQQGAYARPIASIAAQIGLPLWLVELRHAGTHEELPSLELLREGSRESMSWLLRNYFLPTLSPASRPAPSAANLSSPSPLLGQYKQLLKMTTRDASLKSRSKPELLQVLRDIENWISEARVAASMIYLGAQDDEDERERWALERLCDALVDRGGLVPVSKRKRPSPSQGLTVPFPQHNALWSPLILHVQARHPIFPSTLLSRILSHILGSTKSTSESSASNLTTNDASNLDPTYDHTLASWALWIVDRWGTDPTAECGREEVVKELLLGLRREDRRAGRALANALAETDLHLKKGVDMLSKGILSSSRSSAWENDTLETMSDRLSSLRPDSEVPNPPTPPREPAMEDVDMSAPSDPSETFNDKSVKANGWKLLDASHGWKPCPIGVYNHTVS